MYYWLIGTSYMHLIMPFVTLHCIIFNIGKWQPNLFCCMLPPNWADLIRFMNKTIAHFYKITWWIVKYIGCLAPKSELHFSIQDWSMNVLCPLHCPSDMYLNTHAFYIVVLMALDVNARNWYKFVLWFYILSMILCISFFDICLCFMNVSTYMIVLHWFQSPQQVKVRSWD